MNLKTLINKSDYYRIKVIPRQAKTEFRGVMEDGTLKVSLNAAPEKGRANKELIKFLAAELGIEKKAIGISSGLTSRIKIVHIDLS